MNNDLRQRRTDAGLSQSELGGRLGVSRQTINALETGRYLPSLPLALNLARFFGSAVEDIFQLDPEEERP